MKASKQRREIFYQTYRQTRTITDMVRWKRARAEHKSKIRTAKQTSWRNYVSDLKYGAPQSAIYKQIRKIRGKPPKKLNIIKENNNLMATPLDIENKLADTFCNTSSNTNYSDRFIEHKHTAEQNFQSFETNDLHYYNRNFTYSEFDHAIYNSNDSTPGHDKITYSMIRHLPINVKDHLLKLFNKFFRDTFFPH